MQNQNATAWSWNQGGSQPFPTSNQPIPPSYTSASTDQNQLVTGYQQVYSGTTSQQPPDYNASQWNIAQLQHWQQWQQWQEKYQQWQAQYGKKYAESMAAIGQNPNIIVPNVQAVCGVVKPCEIIPNPGYTTVNPPPPPSNAQPVPPPPPEEEKPALGANETGDNPEELSEAEKTFDVQFKQWEDQFNDWKKQNQDHPDKVQYREYEKKWENWREQLLQRREQMRKKRLSKNAEAAKDSRNLGKTDEAKAKGEQADNLTQGKSESGSNKSAGESQNLQIEQIIESKPVVSHGREENQGTFPQQKPLDDNPSLNPTLSEGNHNPWTGNRVQGCFDRDNTNFGNQRFGRGVLDVSISKYGMEGNRGHCGVGSRVESWNRGEFFHRRSFKNGNFEEERNIGFGSGNTEEERNFGPRFGNIEEDRNFGLKFGNIEENRNFGPRFGNIEEDRNFGPKFGNIDGRKSGQDRFRDVVHKDGKYNPVRDSGPNVQSMEQGFSQAPRKYQERNFGGEMKAPFSRNSAKTDAGNSFRSRVPSLFDITVEKPPGLKSPGKDRKTKIWEHENFDEPDKEDKNPQRKEVSWMPNAAWDNSSPWIKPWELGRLAVEKTDKNLRSDAWQKDLRRGIKGEEKGRLKEMRKSDVGNPEYHGHVCKMLGEFGSFKMLPPTVKDKNVPGFLGENSGKVDENLESKMISFIPGQNWMGTGDSDFPNSNLYNQQNQNYAQSVIRGRFEASQGESHNRMENIFGRDDFDDRMRFDRPNFSRDGRRGDRRYNDPSKRDDRGFMEESRLHGNKIEDDRYHGKGDRNSFDKTGSSFPVHEDVDERRVRNRERRGRGFDDRNDRHFRGHAYDRDERRNRGSFERYGRNAGSGAKDMEWNPEVFDYSKANRQGFRTQFSESKDNFRISQILDYSHGGNKQTFDYDHGEAKIDKKLVMSFDYAHGADCVGALGYGHSSERGASELLECKKEIEDNDNSEDGPGLSSVSPQRLLSPKIEPRSRSRSRSPLSARDKIVPDSDSPSLRNQRSRSGDHSGKSNAKRNKRNNSQENSEPGKDEDVSKNNFDVTTVLVEDLICSPGRESRPNKLVFIIRGLPGSGKTYVTKLIKDKEIELGGDAPRILSLDDYFMTEVEKEVTDEETGRKIKKKVLEYEYESCAEPHYRGSLLKAFKKTVSDGFFSFIIVDSVNEKTKDYEDMWSFAKQKGFQVYVAEMDDDVAVCTKRNIHKRTEKEISDLSAVWEKTPTHYLRLDVRSLLQADAITEVEMEVVSDTDLEKVAGAQKEKTVKEKESKEEEEEDEPGVSAFVKSRWDHFENSEQKLDRLDGLKRRREGFHATMEDYLQLPDDFDVRSSEPTDGKKKVRWADLEERRQQEKMRAIGFVVGQTDWSRMTDPTFGESALTRTKYI